MNVSKARLAGYCAAFLVGGVTHGAIQEWGFESLYWTLGFWGTVGFLASFGAAVYTAVFVLELSGEDISDEEISVLNVVWIGASFGAGWVATALIASRFDAIVHEFNSAAGLVLLIAAVSGLSILGWLIRSFVTLWWDQAEPNED